MLLLASFLDFYLSGFLFFLFRLPHLFAVFVGVFFFLPSPVPSDAAARYDTVIKVFLHPSLCDLLLAFVLFIYLLFFPSLPPVAQKGFKLLHEKFIPGSQEIRGLTGHLLQPS